MDMTHGMNDPFDSHSAGEPDEAVADRPLEIGTDERRMHVRAYNHWVSLLHGRAYPSIEDLHPGNIADFGPNSVLLDFTRGVDDPEIRYLGAALREECGFSVGLRKVAEVPSRSLLSRLTDHYLQIIANRAPIGFEAEFVGQRGHNTLYRGILMPFSSDGEKIDFIYGVINWKELVDAATQARLNAEVEASRRAAPAPAAPAPVWADGPSGGFGDSEEPADTETGAELEADTLWDQLSLARESAAAARTSDTRSRAALYRALGHAYDFALATERDRDGYLGLLKDYGLTLQARAPMTPPIKLVFGPDYDKTRVTEFAAVLNHAKRNAVPLRGLRPFLESAEGGIKAIVKAEREHRRPAAKQDVFAQAAAELRSRPPLAHVEITPDGAAGEFVVLLARAGAQGLDIVAKMEDDTALTERAIRRAAA
ncbi:PAS domain-containing protein [Sphingomonas sp. IC-56]|uniref:PAS domain-containing protein n=1 Tax=Sphingomonas sp. IC-56 TaxID=2898529 RepID=UPI003FA70926